VPHHHGDQIIKDRTAPERHNTYWRAETDRVDEAVYDISATVNNYSAIGASALPKLAAESDTVEI